MNKFAKFAIYFSYFSGIFALIVMNYEIWLGSSYLFNSIKEQLFFSIAFTVGIIVGTYIAVWVTKKMHGM